MANLKEAYSALKNANAAGDTAAATQIAGIINRMQQPSQQSQQPTDFAANPRQLKDGEGSDFFRGIGQYTDQYGGIMGGAKMLAGKATGSDSLIESGLKQYKKSEAAVGKRGVKKTDSFTGALDEGLGAVLTEFIPYIAGQGVGMIGEAFLTAGAGALIGGSAAPGVGAVPGAVGGFLSRKFVKDGILDEAKKMSGDVKKQFLRNEVAKQLATQEGRDVIKKGYSKLGRTGGLTYMAGKFGAGEVTGRAVDEALAANPDSTDQLEIIKGLNTGKLAALSAGHALADYFFLKIGLGSLDAMPAGQASRMAAIFRNIGVTGLKEAPIEAVQTVLEREGANLPLADKEALEEYINAAAAGFFMPIIPATVGGIRAPLAGQPTDTTPGEPTPEQPKPGEPTADKTPEAEVETEVEFDASEPSVGPADIDAEVTEVETETETEVDDRQGDLFDTPEQGELFDETEVVTETEAETEATPVVALEDAAQEADRQRINAIVNNDLTEQERLQKSLYQTQLELEENQRNLTDEEKALAAGIAGAPIIGDVAAAEKKLEKAQEAQIKKDKEKVDKANKEGEEVTTLPDTITKEDEAVEVAQQELETINAVQNVEGSPEQEGAPTNEIEAQRRATTDRANAAREQNKRLEETIEEEVKKSVELVGPTQDRAQARTRAEISSQPQTQEEKDSLLKAQQFVTERIEARRLKRLGPQETSSGRTFKQEINLDLTPQGQEVATNKAKRDAAQFIKSNNLTNTYGIQEIKNDNGVTTAITVEEKIEVPDILTQKNNAKTTDTATGNLSNFIFLMQPNIDTSSRRKIRSFLENNIPTKQFEYLTRDAKAFGTVLTKVIENIDKKKKAIKEKAELGKEIKKEDVKRIVQPPSDLVREGKRAEEEVPKGMDPTSARQEELFYKDNPLFKRRTQTFSKDLNQDLTEAGTATKALGIIENFFKDLLGINKQGKTVKNRKNKLGFRNVANLTQMQNVLAGVFANLPGLDGTKFKVSKEMKKGVKGTYDTQTDTITISEQNATLETIFHEMTHAATTNELSKHVDVKTGEALTDTGRKLIQIFTAAKAADTKGDFKNELSNIDEFVTEAINNPKFQRFLANQKNVLPSPPTIQTLWAEFVNAVQEMLDMDIEYTLLNDVLAIAPSLIIGPNKAEQKKQPQRKLYQRDSDDIVDNLSKSNTKQRRNLFQKAYHYSRDYFNGGQDSINKTIINLQNQSYLIKQWQDRLTQTSKLIIGEEGFNNIYDIMVTSFGRASYIVRNELQQPMIEYGEALGRYKELAKALNITDPESQLQAWLTGLHEPERRLIKYVQNVPLRTEAIMTFIDKNNGKKYNSISPADIRELIFSNVTSKESSNISKEVLEDYLSVLKTISNPETSYNGKTTVDTLDGTSRKKTTSNTPSNDINSSDYDVTSLNSAEAQTLRNAYLALETSDPALWESMQEVIRLQKILQDLTQDFNKEAGKASDVSEQLIKFYDFKNYIPIKGKQKSKDESDSQYEITGEMVSGQYGRYETAFEGNAGDAESPFIQTLIDATNAANGLGRQGLTQAIKNAIMNPMKSYTDSVTGKEVKAPQALEGKLVGEFSFADKYGYGKNSEAPQEIQKLLRDKQNILHHNPDGSMEIYHIDNQGLSEAIKTTYTEQHKILEVVGDVTSFLGQMHTRYNLSFGVTNFVRDFITAAGIISADFGFETSGTFLSNIANQVAKRGMKDSWTMGNLYANSAFVTVNGKRIKKATDAKTRKARLKAMVDYANSEKKKGNTYPADQLEYLTEGGMIAYSMGLSTDRAFEEMNKTLQKTKVGKTFEQVRSFFDGYMSTFELATRVSAYRTVRNNYIAKNAPGVPIDQVPENVMKAARQTATVYAKRLANFEEIGKQGKTLGALFMFFRPSATGAVRSLESLAPALRSMAEVEKDLPNYITNDAATLQTWRKDYQARAQRARATIAALGGAGVALVMFSAMLSGDDDEGRNRILTDDSARWNRYARFDISAITGIKGDIFQIPFGFGMGGITALGSQLALIGMGKDNSPLKSLGNISEILLDSFLPLPISRMSIIDNPGQFAFTTVTPTMIRPMLEYTFNMNTFGQQIYRGGTQSRFGDAYAGGDSLPQLYKDIAIGMAEFSNGLIDASPNTLYFWSNAYADGAMRFISNLQGLGYTVAGQKEFSVKYDTQLFNSFFSRVSDIDARKYAETKKDVEKVRGRLNLFKDTNTQEYIDYNKNNPASYAIVKTFDSLNAKLNKLNAQANLLRKMPGLSPQERTQQLRMIKVYQLMLKKGISEQIKIMESYN